MSDTKIVHALTEVFTLSEKQSSRVSPQGTLSKLQKGIEQAGCSYFKIRRNCIGVSILALSIALLGEVPLALVLLVVYVSATALYVSKKIAKRFADVDRDLPALLTFLASSVRAGLDPLIAIIDSQNYLPAGTVLFQEISRFAARIKAGEPEEACIRSFCDEIPHPDLPLLRSCLLISRRHGTSIAEPLHRVTRVVRQRQSFRRKIRGALVMHRMSAIGIVLCAILISLMQLVTNYSAMLSTLKHPIGSKIIAGGALLIFIGLMWMLSMGKKEAQ